MSRELTALVASRPVSQQHRLPGPVLIRVPALGRVAGAPSTRSAIRPALVRRRRLRREVRLAGATLLLLAPLGGAIMAFQAALPEPQGVAARLTGIEGLGLPADEGPCLALPVAPALHIAVPACDGGGPVVLPDYVLPDNGTEEPSHAGG